MKIQRTRLMCCVLRALRIGARSADGSAFAWRCCYIDGPGNVSSFVFALHKRFLQHRLPPPGSRGNLGLQNEDATADASWRTFTRARTVAAGHQRCRLQSNSTNISNIRKWLTVSTKLCQLAWKMWLHQCQALPGTP